jgi:serine phosphatase RsbU (regulator of sigma subunit)
MSDNRLWIGVAGRPYPHETVSGDAHTISWTGDICRITVIDGLGHGREAAEAATRAIETLDAHPTLIPAEGLQRCHTALQGTRGAAISIARLDLGRNELTYAGIGNVEGHVWQGGRHERLISYRGIVGSVMRTVRSFTVALEPAWTFVMHSDGISSRADIAALGLPQPWEPDAVARGLVEKYGRQLDDVLAVVVQPRP